MEPTTPVREAFATLTTPPWWALDSSFSGTVTISAGKLKGTVSTTWAIYYDGLQPSDNQEWYCTVSTLPDASNNAAVYAAVQQPGGTNTWDGYKFQLNNGGTFQLSRFTNNVQTNIGAVVGTPPTPVAGDKIAIQVISGTINGWLFHSGAWTLVWQATGDTTYVGGYGALGGRGTTVALDDFGGGSLVDTSTIPITITASASEVSEYADSGTPALQITPSTAAEGKEFVDSGIAVVAITPSGPAITVPYDSDLNIVSAEQRFTMSVDEDVTTEQPSAQNRFTFTAEPRWSIGDYFK